MAVRACLRCAKTKPMKSRRKNAKYCKACAKKVDVEQRRARWRKWHDNLPPRKKKSHLKRKAEKRADPAKKAETAKYNADYYQKRKKEDPDFRKKRGPDERPTAPGQA